MGSEEDCQRSSEQPNADQDDSLAEPIHGRCLCGNVSITLYNVRPKVDICHCEMCLRWSGSFLGGLSGDEARISGEDLSLIHI